MSFRSMIALCCWVALPAAAQQLPLQLPRPSPTAKLTQTVGLTDISVEYSSPGVKGRKIWGAVVPYGQVWRAGANQATKVTFSKDVTVAGTAVPAGTYSFFTIPTATTWTLVLNKDPNQFGAFSYKKEGDVLRVEVQPKEIPLRERLAYLISDFNDDNASLVLEWEKVSVALPIKLQTQAQALTNIKALSDSGWQPYNSAARYMLETTKDYVTGMQFVDKSLATKEHWFNLWTKAQLLAATGKYRDARTYAEKAKKLGEQTPDDFFASDAVKKALSDWKGKS